MNKRLLQTEEKKNKAKKKHPERLMPGSVFRATERSLVEENVFQWQKTPFV